MTDFVYTSYLKTTPEELWHALTDSDLIQRYWGVALISDWQVGSTVDWVVGGIILADPEQVILAADPLHTLSFTWHSITEEFGRAIQADPEELAVMAAEDRSMATFELTPMTGIVKLTLTHSGFAEGSALRAGISEGWPAILSNLKTFLETGQLLPFE
ncbi:SRPBCC family protein [Psychromicrobium xiongbiense]|uniref:SRPBCC family protein n=1 Tax=Psychromicrobium xiongbiense TaxID=3051184 RepID=UPI0025536E02|nr:SRPBCC family protein [Psychromicrobium sp. YIM S02556]